METMQIRLTKGLIEEIKKLVDRDIYPSTSEAVRDAVRRLVLREEKSVVVEARQVQKSIEKELKKQLKKPTGTVDFYPKDMETRKTIFRKFMRLCTDEYPQGNWAEYPTFMMDKPRHTHATHRVSTWSKAHSMTWPSTSSQKGINQKVHRNPWAIPP